MDYLRAWPTLRGVLSIPEAEEAAQRSRPPHKEPSSPVERFNNKVWEACRWRIGGKVPGKRLLQAIEPFLSSEALEGALQRAMSELQEELVQLERSRSSKTESQATSPEAPDATRSSSQEP